MRRTEQVDMPLKEGVALLHPEAALLKWADTERYIDLGQICYLRRNTSHRKRFFHTFDETSFDSGRVEAVRNMVEHLSDVQRLANFRPQTIQTRTRNLLEFLNWVDMQKLPCDLSEQKSMEAVYEKYVRVLRELVSQNQLNKNSAANMQRNIRLTLAGFFNTETFAADVLQIQNSRKHVESTPVPDQMSQAALLGWCNALFKTISKRLLEFGPYPFAVNGFEYQTEAEKKVWLFPATDTRNNRQLKNRLGAWNYKMGIARTYEEIRDENIAASLAFPERNANLMHTRALTQLRESNENRLASIRLSHGVTASYCFSILFLAETGICLSQLVNMSWSLELGQALQTPSIVRQNFREIKYRALGRIVSFEVTLGFLPKLKTYLELRDFLLRGSKVNLLFITLAKDESPVGLSTQFIARLQTRLNSLGINLPPLSARKWRAAKQDWVMSNKGPVVAAQVMGHTLETAIRSYSNGTDTAHRAEMASFFASLEQTVLRPEKRSSEDVESAVGVCKRFKSPTPISPSVAVKPDCHSSEGCLFCNKYRIHADATDIRKLLSCRYCVRITSNRGASLEEYERSFGAVLRRIEFLLDELRKQEGILVSHIEEDVDVNGNLDFFWASKLEQLFELGLV